MLSTGHPLHEALILAAFVLLALVLAIASVRYAWRGIPAFERTLESSSQLAVRIAVLLVFGLVALASQLGLDILLGGFVAGMITRAALRGREMAAFESKLTAVGFGFLIPFFFVSSGIDFNLDALGEPAAIAKLFLFLALFLVVRGLPAMVLYTRDLARRDRVALAFFSATELPLVVAITTLATEAGPHADLHRGRAGRRRDALDPDLPLRRACTAQAGGGSRGAAGARGRRRGRRGPGAGLSAGPMIGALPGA